MVIFNIAILVFSCAFSTYLVSELKDYTTADRGQNGFFLALAINNIITCIGKLA